MQWLDDYNIGVSHIDKQHKELANTLKRLQGSLSSTYVNNEMANTLKFLVSYTQQHFSDEEELMESIGYSDFKNHKSLHKNLIDDVRTILLKLKNNEAVNAKELIEFLIRWLIDHIVKEDSKIGSFIQKLESK
ncbi:MAG: hemerythrin family protein [Desulfobacterales bacterium]|nr:hemerythrin family protein [Desulfobacterales bacterium]